MAVKACHGDDPFDNNDTHSFRILFTTRRCKTGVNREPDDYLRIYFCLSIKVHSILIIHVMRGIVVLTQSVEGGNI